VIRILSVGAHFYSGQIDIENVDSLALSPSLFDFDAIVVHPSHAWTRSTQKDLTAWHVTQTPNIEAYSEPLIRKQEEANHLLENGGLIISILGPVEGVTYDRTATFTSYDWIPVKDLSKRMKEGTGRRIKIVKASPFDNYLELSSIAFSAHLDKDASYDALALNEAGYAVAAQVKSSKGSIFLLPGTILDNGLQTLFDCISQVVSPRLTREPPLWTKDIQVPGEAIIVKGLKTIDEKVSSLRVDDEKLTRRLKEITALKKILYEQGEPLEKAVRTALSELGLPARKEGDIDLVTIEEKEPLIIEITGSEGLIGIDKFRQLLNYVMTEQEQGKEIPKSVLIANHQISTPPEKRSNPFTDKAVEQAKVFHSCLLPTVELFNAVVLLREGRIDQKRFRDALMKTDGVFASSQLIREAKP
jgi:hypothetical protein